MIHAHAVQEREAEERSDAPAHACRIDNWSATPGKRHADHLPPVLTAGHDVQPMPGRGEGYRLDVQPDLLRHLATHVVVPLLPEAVTLPISELNPVFEINGARHVMVTQAFSAVPNRELKPAVVSLSAQHDLITKALDLLLIGFARGR